MEKKKVIGYRYVPSAPNAVLEHTDLNKLQTLVKQTYPTTPGVYVHVTEITRIIQTVGLVENW